MSGKTVSVEDLAKDIDNIFVTNRKAQEEKIDIPSFMKNLHKEITHNVLCKSLDTFELWPKIRNMDNLIKIVNELEKSYSSSSFSIEEYDSISSFIKCSFDELDISAIRSSIDKESERYKQRSEVLLEKESHRKSLQEKYHNTMTLLNQKALELQETHERRIREIRNEQAVEKIRLDALINDTPKQYKTELEELDNKIGLLKKCSHGFLYEGTVFTKIVKN